MLELEGEREALRREVPQNPKDMGYGIWDACLERNQLNISSVSRLTQFDTQ